MRTSKLFIGSVSMLAGSLDKEAYAPFSLGATHIAARAVGDEAGSMMTAVPLKSRYDGLNVLLPQVGMLLPGDVILTSNVESASRTSGKQSGLIRKATSGRFSHVLICSSPPIFVEAIGTGVSTLSLARCFAHERENVRVLRYHDAEISKRASEYAQLEVGRDYSVARAIQSIFGPKTLAKIDDHGIFCSALVAQVFSSAGATEFAETPVDKTTPATIDKMAGFSDITDEVFRIALAPRNIETMTALDGDAMPTPTLAQTEIANRYGKALMPVAVQLKHKLPHLGAITPTTFGLIDLILCAYDEVEKLPAHERSEINQILQSLDRGLADLISSGEMISLFEEVKRVDDATHQKTLIASFDAHPDIDAVAMAGSLETTRTTVATRRRAAETLLKWNRGRSKAADQYLKVEAFIIDSLAQREPLLMEILRRIA